ncbi:MAG: MFS transporter [Alphaproteobacteria bacterium]|jgi:MFS family permease|nr:MFS transporter [Alphaproteobacteria bacterium]
MGENQGERRAELGWGVVLLLALAVFCNYVDRGNLATAAPVMKQELHLGAAALGLLLSAFFWTYTPCQILVGLLIERINPYRTLGLGLGLWALATFATGLASGFSVLIGLRLVMGLGESAAFPSVSTILARRLDPRRLGRANALTSLGVSLGPAFGTFAGGLVLAHWGWRVSFLAFGVISALWLAPWVLATRREARAAPASSFAPGPPFLEILRRRAAWGVGLGHFSANYGAYFVLSWLPLYLVKVRGFSLSAMAREGGLIYLAYGASTWAFGWLTDRLIAAGLDESAVHKANAVASHILVATGLMSCALFPTHGALPGLWLAGVGMGVNAGGKFAVGQILAGARAAPRWISLQNLAGNVAGMVGPAFTGFLIQSLGGFTAAFVTASLVSLLGAVGWAAITPKVEPLAWSEAPA